MTSPVPQHSADTSELPVHLTRFIGRDRELDDLARLVGNARLLTLTGAGGSGKTRLARELAMRTSDAFARIDWVDLAPLGDGAFLAQQIASSLHVQEQNGISSLNTVVEALRDARALLVLDNCEHLVDAVASCVESLLRACPRVTVLATSREALGVASEAAWLIPPMATPDAVELFHERARLALPAFGLTEANAPFVHEICRRLDGIPLAIELAAARVRVLTPEQIASRLDDAFRLLASGNRTALPRHRTLRATMEWSYGLLAPREQILLRRLAIFAGAFTLDAAELVCAGDSLGVEDILDGVAALVDKSLIVMDAGDGLARYRLLETVRQYGLERLDDAGERDRVSHRFARHYLDLVESIAPHLVGGPAKPGLIERLAADHDNIRAALMWALTEAGHAELALRFVGGLYWLWYALGQFREARNFTDRALALENTNIDPLIVGRAHVARALTHMAQGEYREASSQFDAALPLLRAAGDRSAIGTALAKKGGALTLGDEIDAAIRVLDEALAFTADAPANDIARIFALFWRGWAAYKQGDLALAQQTATTNIAAGREHKLPTTLGHSLTFMAEIDLARDNLESACAFAAEALEVETTTGDGWGIAIALDVVSRVAARRGRLEDAARLMGAVEAHRKRIAVALPGLSPRDRDATVAMLRSTLGAQFDSLVAEGATWTLDEMLHTALAEASRHTFEHRITAPAPWNDGGAAQPKLRVLALGSLQVFVGDRQIDATAWGSARPRELLVYLLMHPEGRTKEQVGLAFWPEASSSQLRNNFHVTMHRLRKALGGADWITLEHDRYRVDPAMVAEFDAALFETEMQAARRALKRQQPDGVSKLEAALARFRGDLLDGEPVNDWHIEHRDRLQRMYIDGLMELGVRLAADDRPAKAAEAYRRVLARDELHEEALVALMRCQAASGERAQALRVYRRFADRLRDELDAEPGAAAVQLCEQLQQGASVA